MSSTRFSGNSGSSSSSGGGGERSISPGGNGGSTLSHKRPRSMNDSASPRTRPKKSKGWRSGKPGGEQMGCKGSNTQSAKSAMASAVAALEAMQQRLDDVSWEDRKMNVVGIIATRLACHEGEKKKFTLKTCVALAAELCDVSEQMAGRWWRQYCEIVGAGGCDFPVSLRGCRPKHSSLIRNAAVRYLLTDWIWTNGAKKGRPVMKVNDFVDYINKNFFEDLNEWLQEKVEEKEKAEQARTAAAIAALPKSTTAVPLIGATHAGGSGNGGSSSNANSSSDAKKSKSSSHSSSSSSSSSGSSSAGGGVMAAPSAASTSAKQEPVRPQTAQEKSRECRAALLRDAAETFAVEE